MAENDSGGAASKPPAVRPQGGGGSRLGKPNKVARENIERARTLGPLPHEAALFGMHYWLKIVNDAHRLAEANQSNGALSIEQRQAEGQRLHSIISAALDKVLEFATPAMPYYAPRLQAIAHAHRHQFDLSKLSDDDLDTLERLSAAAYAGRDSGGAGETEH